LSKESRQIINKRRKEQQQSIMTTSVNHNNNAKSSVNNRIENCETIGRKYFNKIVNKVINDVKSVSFTGITDRHDCNVDTTEKSYVVEIKVRTPAHDKYSTVILKKAKYDHLMSGVGEGFTPLYVNFYSDGVVAVWNLETAKIRHKRDIYVRKTEMNSNSEMEWQEFYEFHIEDARKYSYKQ